VIAIAIDKILFNEVWAVKGFLSNPKNKDQKRKN
jgi:hypothetical protein